jgi:hypothetical protein
VDDYRGRGPTDGRRWTERRRELRSLIAYGLETPEIANELKVMRIPAIEVTRAVGDRPDLLARYRVARDWPNRLGLNDSPLALRRGRRKALRLPRFGGLTACLVIVLSYTTLLWNALPRMPLPQQLFSLAGLVCVLALGGWLARADVLVVHRVVRNPSPLDDILEDVVLPELRQYITEQREPNYGTEMPVASTLDDDREAPTVVTSAGRELRKILGRPTAEAVAIAGPRGVGKTTTIRAVAEGMFSDPDAPPPLAVVASAPSRYDARDFVLHLHVVLCQKVVALTSAVLLLPPFRQDRRPFRDAMRIVLLLAGQVLPLAALIGVAMLLWPGPYQELIPTAWRQIDVTDLEGLFAFDASTSGRERPALVVTIIAIFYAALLAFLWVGIWVTVSIDESWRRARRYRRRRRYLGLTFLREEALDQLQGIRFLQTYTSGWSGKIGLPIGSDAGWSASVQRAEQNRTHPEVVEDFRRFAKRCAKYLIDAEVIDRLVIAIDELDKIADPAQAHELVNDIKGIFEIPHCQFIVSVSEDAMSAFERRGIPVRDAFDSAFTQMVRMDHFTLAESRRWLSRRLLGVPEQFTYLLHCLSGGLPRELRRVTIELVEIIAEDERGDLEHVTEVLLGRELDRKAHAFMAAARQFDDTAERSEYLADLVTMPHARTPAAQTALATRLKPGEQLTELRQIRWQSACFLLYCATVREIFDDTLDEAGLGKGLESLALARTQLAVDPQVAWRLVESVREARA